MREELVTTLTGKFCRATYALRGVMAHSLTGFVCKILENADEQDIRDVFRPLIAAFEFVRGA